jgi:uncharacterized protein with FMN-binding domain
MSGTKIFVLQMKDVIRIGLFAILGIIVIVMLVILFIPEKDASTAPPPSSSSQGQYIPGTYSSSIILNNNPLDVRVTVSESNIVSVEMTDMDNVQRVFYPLFEPAIDDLAAQVLESQTVELVSETEYPVTNGILKDAISTALAKAVIAE